MLFLKYSYKLLFLSYNVDFTILLLIYYLISVKLLFVNYSCKLPLKLLWDNPCKILSYVSF